MKKIHLGQTIQILANIGVIAGIVFLAIEVRQANNAVKSSTLQAIAEQSYQTSARTVDNSELRAALRAVREGEALTDDQQDLLEASYFGLLRLQQNRFQQLRLGVLDDDTLFEVGGNGPGYSSPFFRAFWQARRTQFSDEFQAFMEERVLPLSE